MEPALAEALALASSAGVVFDTHIHITRKDKKNSAASEDGMDADMDMDVESIDSQSKSDANKASGAMNLALQTSSGRPDLQQFIKTAFASELGGRIACVGMCRFMFLLHQAADG